MEQIACVLVSEKPQPAVPSHTETCVECKQHVWVSTALRQQVSKADTICIGCFPQQ